MPLLLPVIQKKKRRQYYKRLSSRPIFRQYRLLGRLLVRQELPVVKAKETGQNPLLRIWCNIMMVLRPI